MSTIVWSRVESPVGALLVSRDEVGLTGLWLPHGRHRREPAPSWARDDTAFADAREQLDEYFAGSRREFELPLHLIGTPFQQQVWGALLEVRFGETSTYGAQARRIGVPVSAARAVGTANGANPVSIIVPCHRIIGANGSLVGYGGGLPNKRWLLSHEAALSPPPRPSLLPSRSSSPGGSAAASWSQPQLPTM